MHETRFVFNEIKINNKKAKLIWLIKVYKHLNK